MAPVVVTTPQTVGGPPAPLRAVAGHVVWIVLPMMAAGLAAVAGSFPALLGVTVGWSVAWWLGPGLITARQRRWWLAVGGLLLLLALKDIWPTGPGRGAVERHLALAAEGWSWLAEMRTPSPGPGAGQWAALVLAAAAAAGLTSHLQARPQRRAWLGATLAWLLAGFGAAVAWGTDPAKPYGADNCVGVVLNKNGAGMLVALGIAAQLGGAARCFRQSRVGLAWVHGLVAAALLVPLVRLGAWTGLSTLGATLVVLPWALTGGALRRRRLWWAAAAGLVAVVLVASFSPVLTARLARLGGDFRWSIWRDCLPMAAQHPWGGVGLSAFADVYPLWGTLPLSADTRLAHPDSSWVRLVLEWGLLPFGVLAALVVGWWRTRPDDGRWDLTARMAVAVGAGWWLSGATDNTWYRPESVVVLVGLAAVVGAQPTASAATWSRRWCVLPVIAFAAAVATWSAQATALPWAQLDPERHWRAAAVAARSPEGFDRALAHWRAAVRLQHRSSAYPVAVARSLHAARPELAKEFWRAAFRRAGEREGYYFQPAVEQFPATPWTYWREVIAEAGPDLWLRLPRVPPWEIEPWASRWLATTEGRTISPDTWQLFFERVTTARCTVLLIRAMPAMGRAAPALVEPAARYLVQQGEPAAAWRALQVALPAPERPATAELPLTRVATLVKLGDYAALARAVGARPGDRAALAHICAEPGAPAWFFGQLAWVQAEAGQWTEAVAAGLEMRRRAQERRP